MAYFLSGCRVGRRGIGEEVAKQSHSAREGPRSEGLGFGLMSSSGSVGTSNSNAEELN